MQIQKGRQTLLAAVALLAAGFGSGLLTAKLASHTSTRTEPAQAAAGGIDWPFFGKPRDAAAPRGAVKKPDGFAVWTTRLDLKPQGPSACIRMSRPLDPRKSYGDF